MKKFFFGWGILMLGLMWYIIYASHFSQPPLTDQELNFSGFISSNQNNKLTLETRNTVLTQTMHTITNHERRLQALTNSWEITKLDPEEIKNIWLFKITKDKLYITHNDWKLFVKTLEKYFSNHEMRLRKLCYENNPELLNNDALTFENIWEKSNNSGMLTAQMWDNLLGKISLILKNHEKRLNNNCKRQKAETPTNNNDRVCIRNYEPATTKLEAEWRSCKNRKTRAPESRCQEIHDEATCNKYEEILFTCTDTNKRNCIHAQEEFGFRLIETKNFIPNISSIPNGLKYIQKYNFDGTYNDILTSVLKNWSVTSNIHIPGTYYDKNFQKQGYAGEKIPNYLTAEATLFGACERLHDEGDYPYRETAQCFSADGIQLNDNECKSEKPICDNYNTWKTGPRSECGPARADQTAPGCYGTVYNTNYTPLTSTMEEQNPEKYTDILKRSMYYEEVQFQSDHFGYCSEITDEKTCRIFSNCHWHSAGTAFKQMREVRCSDEEGNKLSREACNDLLRPMESRTCSHTHITRPSDPTEHIPEPPMPISKESFSAIYYKDPTICSKNFILPRKYDQNCNYLLSPSKDNFRSKITNLWAGERKRIRIETSMYNQFKVWTNINYTQKAPTGIYKLEKDINWSKPFADYMFIINWVLHEQYTR